MKEQTLLKNTRDYQAYLIQSLQDPDEAVNYLQVALDEYEEDGDPEAFLIALRNVTEACGGITKLAQKVHLSRQHLYRALSSEGNPRIQTLGNILHGLGFRLSIERASAA